MKDQKYTQNQVVASTKATLSADRGRRTLKSLIIEPFKQIKFGLYVIGLSVAFAATCAGMFVMAFQQQYEHVMSIFNVVDPTMKWELVTNDVFYTNAVRLGILLVLFVGVMFHMVFRLTHRYYGPLVSIERFVDQVSAGHYNSRVTVRNKDELQKLAAKLNKMAEKLEMRHGKDASTPAERKREQIDEARERNAS